MKQCVIVALLLLSINLSVSCQESETVIVTREIITSVTLEVTATPGPTAMPNFLGGGGQYIAFTVQNEDKYFGVFLLDTITKEPQSLTTVKIDGAPKWSSDGTKIAFIAQDNDERDILIVNLESDETTRLFETSLNAVGFDWSPSGAEIAFLGTQPDEIVGSLYKINIDGSNQEEIATREDFAAIINAPVDWSTEDEVFVSAFVRADEGPPLRSVQIFQVNLADGQMQRISDERFDYYWADLSPDASHILFFSLDEEKNLDLFLMNANGNKLQHLSNFAVVDPAWSPDSRQIAYAFNGSISTMDVHEGTAVVIVSMYDTRAPAWSPDGKWIVFAGKSKENSYFQLYIVRADGTDLTLLTNTEEHHDLPVWQP